jgi:protein SCO1/2
LAACGSSASTPASSQVPGSSASSAKPASKGLEGLVVNPPLRAPPLALDNYTHTPVSLASYRGQAALVTFVYTHCPNVCPLIVSNLAAAQRALGKEADKIKIIAVTVDPRRDTPAAIKSFLAARGATGRMDYLIGKRSELLPIWKAWHVGISVDTKTPIVGHTSIVYGINATGQIAVIYPANFSPAEIVHDVPLLTRS